jgi:transcriptional regulator GlxA family with amidase domain
LTIHRRRPVELGLRLRLDLVVICHGFNIGLFGRCVEARTLLGSPATTATGEACMTVQGMRAQRELVRRIDRYLIAAGSRPVHISELCEHFNVHRRKLHRAFQDVLGIGPIVYLHRKRLGEVHAALLTVDPGAKVADIARANGFHELGRFAASYRRTFGELPSQTLQRSRRHDVQQHDAREARALLGSPA